MAGSAIPLSLLAKGIGQVVSNGHEKLEVYLEPEDYYNLKKSNDHAASYEHNEEQESIYGVPMPLHKTFVTRKGALLIFSEELANKAIAEQVQRLGLANVPQKNHSINKQWEEGSMATDGDSDSLRTLHDLSWAILTYGSKPEYRKKGEDLFMRFIHETNRTKPERRIRPGFSPTRYISTWSKYWNDSLLQKLRTDGLISDKTLYRQNPVLPHLYQPASYNMSSVPVPYKVTKTMLKSVPMMESYRKNSDLYKQSRVSDEFANNENVSMKQQKGPPPSHQDSEEQSKQPFGPIEAVKFLKTGEIEEVKYSELRPREKQEILAELLASAYEQQKHIQETLELVLSSQHQRNTRSGASSSAASELMVDMHRAIMTLVESPVRKQIMEKQRILLQEKRDKKQEKEIKRAEKEARRTEKENQRRIRRDERERLKLEKDAAAKQMHEDQVIMEKQQRRKERERRRELRQLEKEEQKKEEERLEEERIKVLEERKRLKEEARNERHRRRREAQEKQLLESREREDAAHEVSNKKTNQNDRIQSIVEDIQQAPVAYEERKHVKVKHRNQVAKADNTANEQTLQQAKSDAKKLKEAFMDATTKTPQAPHNTPAQTTTYIKQRKQIANASLRDSESFVSNKSSKRGGDIHPSSSYVDNYDDGDDDEEIQQPQQQKLSNKNKQRTTGLHHQKSISSKHSQESVHSTVQQKAFAIPNFGSQKSNSSKTSSFYGGKMPVTSNIFKPAMSDKISLSLHSSVHDKSDDIVSSKSGHNQATRGSIDNIKQYKKKNSLHVPLIDVEPATPMMQQNAVVSTDHTQTPVKKNKLAPVPPSKDSVSKHSDEEYASSIASSKSSKSSVSKQASKVSKSTATVSSQKYRQFNTLPGVEATYSVMKGSKGPGSQVSSSYLKSSSKSSFSKGSRGSIPEKLQVQSGATVYLPGGKIMPVGKSITKYSEVLPSITTEEDAPSKSSREKSSLSKTTAKSISETSQSSAEKPSKSPSYKFERKISFKGSASEKQPSEKLSSTKKSSAKESETEEETEWEETEESENDWPDVKSERSSKLANKVAGRVISANRAGSNLEEDALKAAELWNAVAKEEEEGSIQDSESENESEDEETMTAEDSEALFKQAAAEQEHKELKEKEKMEKEKFKKEENKTQKEITARVKEKKKTSRSPSMKSESSGKSSYTSAQESFISDLKQRASEIGVNEKDLEFEAEVVSALTESTIKSEDVAIVKDPKTGKHIVLSRSSSTTEKSAGKSTVSKISSTKKQIVVDMPSQKKSKRDGSPGSQGYKTPMSDASSVSGRRSSIPVDQTDVQLDYQVTNYESKLGDPKSEEPIKVKTNREPEKIKKSEKSQEIQRPTQKDAKLKPSKQQEAKKYTKNKSSDNGSDAEKSSSKSTVISTQEQKKKKTEGKKREPKPRAPLDKPKTVVEKVTRTPETPFVAGRAKTEKAPTDTEPLQKDHLSPGGTSESPTKDVKQDKLEKTLKTDYKTATSPKASPVPEIKQQESIKEIKSEIIEAKPEDEEDEFVTPSPSKTPDDDYDFVRVESEEEEEEDIVVVPEPDPEKKQEDDRKSVKSDATAKTAKTDGTAEDQKSPQEDEAEKEAKLAMKKERENKRAAAAEKRRIEVERKRKEKEEQARKEREEQERQEQLREEFEAEKKRREEAVQKKKEAAEREKQKELEEEEMRKRREELAKEKEKRQQEEFKKKMEEMQRRKRIEEEKRMEAARIKREEEEQRRKEEEEMLAAMEEAEREEYQRQKAEEEERLRILAEEKRTREEEEARIAMEQARLQAILRAKQQAALEEKMRFVREFMIEANGMEQTQNVNRAFSFSYFEILNLLGLKESDFSFAD